MHEYKYFQHIFKSKIFMYKLEAKKDKLCNKLAIVIGAK